MSRIREFQSKVAKLDREDIIDLIRAQDPELVKQVNRIEWVFKNKLTHLTWSDGSPVEERPLTNEELSLILDPPFSPSDDLRSMGLNIDQQRQIHIASDPVLWAKHFLNATPRVYQILMLRHPSIRKVLRAGRRLGKALDVSTPIPTPNGWKTMGDLQEGDQVFDESGDPCNVTFATEYQYGRQCYEVKFSDGSSLIADADHQWTVDTKQSRKARGRAINPKSRPITLTTAEMLDNLYVQSGSKMEVNYSIDNAGPVHYPEKELILDPWLFGLWLGDGTCNSGVITIGHQDQKETLQRIESAGFSYHKTSARGDNQFQIKDLWHNLNKLGVLRKYRSYSKENDKWYEDNQVHKYIPADYLQGSISQREALLKGLMDSDGTVAENGNCEFSVCNEQLAKDVYELVQSLGYRATWKSGPATLEGRVTGTRYRINWTPWRPVFYLKRKLERQKLADSPSARQRCRYIVSITPVDTRPVKCITVDSASSLYLAGKNFIPTHNTYTMALMVLHYAYTHKNGRILVMAPMKPQVGLIYEEVMKLAKNSDAVLDSITRSVTSPQYEIHFSNGSTVRFFTTGLRSGGKSDVARGQEAHLIILDELDYMGPDDLDALYAMLQKTDDNQPDKILVGASTPTGRRERFWEWSRSPRFKEFWFPSYANPHFDKAIEEEMRAQYNEMAYRHEIEADWGEDVEGVYPRKYVDAAFSAANWEYIEGRTSARSDHLIGVDWDKYGAGPNIVVLEICHENYEDEKFANKLRVAYREEIPRNEYVLTQAVDRIIELNAIFNPKHIYVDRGYGDTQVELLAKYGVEHPQSGIKKKLKGVSFSQMIEMKDPATKQTIKKEMKPFMVDNLRTLLESNQILFPEHDEELYLQLISYVVLRTTAAGRPVFEASGSQVDHAHDALVLACLAYTQNYGDLMKVNLATRARSISNDLLLPMFEPPKGVDVDKLSDQPIRRTRSGIPQQRRRKAQRPIQRKTF